MYLQQRIKRGKYVACIKIRSYVRHKAEAQLQIGMLREPQDLSERAACGPGGAGCRPLINTIEYLNV